jgi:DNA topoisomerase-1
MSSLVIVESPAKAKTLSQILGPDFRVEASYGHVRDLPESADQIPVRFKKQPWGRLGVNVESDFEPIYVIPKDKKKHIKLLQEALQNADELLLATDEDREGESISWHVVEVLKPEVPVRRIVFHEITDEAIHKALEHPRDIDDNLVRAQESRRILDRLFGYELSPVLWKKVRSGLSAGRVQSVAVRLCVERERARRRFKVAKYWDAEVEFEKNGQRFTARLVRVGDRRLATGKDFDPDSGELKANSNTLWLQDEADIDKLLADWGTPWSVQSVESKPVARRPYPPFTTSSLQQDANRKLRFSARHTMRVAQRLYEGIDVGGEREGLITYMRTDSTTLAERALREAQQVIRSSFGDDYTSGPRRYKTKSKMAQEAHEAIRPTVLSRTPDQVQGNLSKDEYRLYDLIWKRTVASQMTDARLRRTVVEIEASSSDPSKNGTFTATGTIVEFAGFLKVYTDSSSNDSEQSEQEVLLPDLEAGEEIEPREVQPKGRETTPPARYNEASLVKKLETEGIGRPSTYASIIETIQRRGYVVKQGNALVPTFTAFAVTELLESHFPDLVDTQFTARMEQRLDDIAAGKRGAKDHLREFYFGVDPDSPGLEARIAAEEPRIEFPRIEIGSHPDSGNSIVVRVGRFGPYLQQEVEEGENRIAASVPDDVPPADLTLNEAVDLLDKAKKGNQTLGTDPESGDSVYLAHGRYGAYVQLGETPERGSKDPKPRRASVPKGIEEADVTFETAMRWLALPKVLGVDAESGEEVVAATGRFGPFVKRGSDTRSVGSEDDIYTLELPRALEILAQPKKGRGRGRAARKILKDYGDGEGGKVQLLDGPYGPYLTNGELNASLPKGNDPEKLAREDAVRILTEKGKPPKRGRKKSTRKSKS